MTLKFITAPKGVAPAIAPEKLPDNYAQVAENCSFRRGIIAAIAGLSSVGTYLGSTAWRTLYRYGSNWLYWTDADINVVRGQLAAGNNRLFYTGDGYPKQTDTDLMPSSGMPDSTADYRRLGVTPPTGALTINIVGSGSGVTEDSVSYYYTYVCKWSDGTEEESAPSTATAVTDIEEDEYVYLTGFVIPSLAASGNNITHVRVYRLNSGSNSAEYQHIKCRPGSAGATEAWDIAVTHVNDITDPVYDCNSTPDGLTASLGDTSQVEDWDAPPDDLTGIVQYMNHVLAGFSGKNVCLSEPLVHYAWPEEYYNPVDYDIVSIGVFNQSLIVTTGTIPYRMTGTDPASIYTQPLPYEQPCLSKRGTVSTNIGVIYPSPDGLFLINDDGGQLLTKKVLTKEAWTDLPPDGFDHGDLISFYYDSVYYGFWAGSDQGFMFNFTDDLYLITFNMGDLIYHGCKDPETDALYLLTAVGSTHYAKQWEAGSDLTYAFKSKRWETPPVCFSYAMVIGEQSVTDPITFKIYGDEAQVERAGVPWSKSVQNQDIFRLPSGEEYRTHEIEISGTKDCRAIMIATSAEEIEEVIKKL